MWQGGDRDPRHVADAAAVPADLDAGGAGPSPYPDPRRRRAAGVVYLVAAGVAGVGTRWELPRGILVVAAGLAALGVYHFLSAWPLAVTDGEALTVAGRAVSFSVGHASAAVRFRSWRARPTWSVVVYSADEPPTRRGLVLVDGVTGEQLGDPYEEALPAPA